MTTALDRKDFLRIFAVAGAGLALGVEFTPATAAAAAPPVVRADGWIEMGNDGLTTVVINQSELGQGITTALSMCVADELDIPMSSVRFRMAPAEAKYNNPVTTPWERAAAAARRRCRRSCAKRARPRARCW